MKNNQFITNNEIAFPKERYLVSKTDLQGRIVSANDEFIRISGFTREELIGKSHNIVRHPDMPKQLFVDLWQTLKRGDPWRGLVKNRAKNGDYYWVDAFIAPIKQNGVTTGYMSVRSEPSRQQIAEAEALYQHLQQSGKPLPSTARPSLGLMSRLMMTIVVTSILLFAISLVGLRGMQMNNQNRINIRTQQFEPALALQNTLLMMNDAYKHAILGAEHNPANGLSKLHNHSLERHIDVIENSIKQIVAIRPVIAQHPKDSVDGPMLDDFNTTTMAYIESGLKPIVSNLKNREYDNVAFLAEVHLSPLYEEASNNANTLLQHILDEDRIKKRENQHEYQRMITIIMSTGLIGILLMLFISRFHARNIARQMEQTVQEFDFIAEGVMTRSIDIYGTNEFGRMNKSLAMMQTNIKIMLDSIREAVMVLLQKSADLDAQMHIVLMTSRAQQAQVEKMAVNTEQFSHSVSSVADKANQTAHIATDSQQLVEACNNTMSQSMEANTKVVATVNDSSNIIIKLNQSIQRIGDVTTTIRTIADQTNLLALNAAIEAARAGEAGRGFAVVADEVRKLSEHTANSTTDITALVTEIHRIAESAVSAMQHAVTEVDAGVGKMHESVDGLNQITAASHKVTNMAMEISNEASEQSAAGVEVSAGMVEVAHAVERNVEIAKQASDLSRDLLDVAAAMRTLMESFELFNYSAEEKAAMEKISSAGSSELF